MQNSTKVAVGLATFGFITFVLFIILSSPIELVFGIVEEQATNMNISSDVNPIIGNLRTVFGLTFVLSMVGLVVWGLLATHQEEYEETVEQPPRYYR